MTHMNHVSHVNIQTLKTSWFPAKTISHFYSLALSCECTKHRDGSQVAYYQSFRGKFFLAVGEA